MSFQRLSGTLWRVAVSQNGTSKNIFVTARDSVAAMEQAKAIDSACKITAAEEVDYVICGHAPLGTVMWVPRK